MKTLSFRGFFLCDSLSLRELRCTTSALESVLLSLLHTRITSKEASLLEEGLVGLICGKECTSNTVTDCTCLAGEATAVYVNNYVELANSVGNAEGLVNDELHGLKTEVLVDAAAVDGDLAGAGVEANASDRLLSAAGAVEVGLCTSIHSSMTFLSIN